MPKTRSASLRVAHTRSCPNATKTSLASLRGCKCKPGPSYYTSHRDAGGNVVKSERVRDRQVADRALRKLQVNIDEERVDLRRRETITFGAWADERVAYIEEFNRKPATVRAYKGTLSYARPILGSLNVADIGEGELMRVVRAIREGGGGDTTLRKHLKQLSTFLTAAVPRYINRSPLTAEFVKDLRLAKPEKGTPPYTDVEFEKLINKMRALDYESVYITATRFAAATGLRIGELIALNWDDVDLVGGTLRVSRTWDPIVGSVKPKDSDERTVHLIPGAVAILEAWVGEQGVRPGNAPVFSAPRSGGRLNGRYLTKVVEQAMTKAGILKVEEGGRPRKPFHSLRATFARRAREQGADPQWLQSELGHASLDLTIGTYSTWQDAAMRKHADALDFPV
jgi:integrase